MLLLHRQTLELRITISRGAKMRVGPQWILHRNVWLYVLKRIVTVTAQ